MSDLLRLIVEVWAYLFPFRTVESWQRGVVAIWGRYWRTVGPGVWPFVPYFTAIRPVDVVPAIHGTPLQTITLRDNRALTYSATITVQVQDAAAAFNTVEHWSETAVELVSGLLSETLAHEDPDRFSPDRGKRGRLLEDLRAKADEETSKFGVRVLSIRFGNFAIGLRTYRLLSDRSTLKDCQ